MEECYFYKVNVKNTHGVVLFLLKKQVSDCKFTKSTTPPWVFFMFFKLYKCYQIRNASLIYYEAVLFIFLADEGYIRLTKITVCET